MKKYFASITLIFTLALSISCTQNTSKKIQSTQTSVTKKYYDQNEIFLNSLDFTDKKNKELLYLPLELDKSKFSRTTIPSYSYNKKLSSSVLKTKKFVKDKKEIWFEEIQDFQRTTESIILKNVTLKIRKINGKSFVKRQIDEIKLSNFKVNKNLMILESITSKEILEKHNLIFPNKINKFPSEVDDLAIVHFNNSNNKIVKKSKNVFLSIEKDSREKKIIFRNNDVGKITYIVRLKIDSNSQKEFIEKKLEITGFKNNKEHLNSLKEKIEKELSSHPKKFFILDSIQPRKETSRTGTNIQNGKWKDNIGSLLIKDELNEIKEKIKEYVNQFINDESQKNNLEILVSNKSKENSFRNIKQDAGLLNFQVKIGNFVVDIVPSVYIMYKRHRYENAIVNWMDESENIKKIEEFILQNKKFQALDSSVIYTQENLNNLMGTSSDIGTLEDEVTKFIGKEADTSISAILKIRKITEEKVDFDFRITKMSVDYSTPFFTISKKAIPRKLLSQK